MPCLRDTSRYVVLIFVVLLAAAAEAAAVEEPIQAEFSLLVVPTGTDPHAIHDGLIAADEFQPLSGGRMRIGFGRFDCWIRIERYGSQNLLVLSAMVDEAELYVGGDAPVLRAGDTVAASARPVLSRQIVFPLPSSSPGEPLYLRIRQPSPVAVQLILENAETYWQAQSRDMLLTVALLGAIVIMILYNCALSVTTRDATFLWNALAIASMLLLAVYLNGIGAAYLWAEQPWLSNLALMVSLLGACAAGAVFFRLFLSEADGTVPRPARLLNTVPLLASVLALCIPFFDYWRVMMGIYALLPVTFIALFAAILPEALRGNRRAMALTAPLFLSISPGLSIVIAEKFLGADFGFAGTHMLEFTLAGEAILFSLALAYRIRLAEEERLDAHDQLVRFMGESERRVLSALDGERSRIAADLHETAGQGLLAITNRLSRIVRTGKIPDGIRDEIASVEETSKDVVGDIRRISHELHAVGLQQLGFGKALGALADRVASVGGMKVEIDNQIAAGTLTEEQSRHVYRIVQELLVNAVKHSGGRNTKVSIAPDGGGVKVIVEDDGRPGAGGASPAATAQGIGLELVAQRIRCLNGRVVRDRNEGNGFEFRFPFADCAEAGRLA
jgi:signal transduction histidine kinase